MRVLLLVAITFLMTSCERSAEKEMAALMGKYYMQKLLFPSNTKLVNKDNADNQNGDSIRLDGKSYYVIHFFTADCDKCIEEIKAAQSFIEKNPDLRVKYIFIASGPTDIYVSNAAKSAHFKLPVFFEREYFSFKHLNNFPEENRTYNTMLINGKGDLLFFGGFFSNPKAQSLLREVVKREI